jgi:hypothetical protein
LASGNGTEGYQKFVVNRLGIVEERPDDFLNVAFTVFVKELGSVCFWGELGLNAIGDWQALVRGETRLDWTGMLKPDEQVFDVTWHTDAKATICIVPFDINTSKLSPAMLHWTLLNFLRTSRRGKGYSVLLANCPAICSVIFVTSCHFCMGQNILVNESIFFMPFILCYRRYIDRVS